MDPQIEKKLIEVYKLAYSEEQFFTTLFENRLSFYSGLLTTIITALIVGISQYYQEKIEIFPLLIGPLVIIFVAYIAIQAAERATQRISKILTVRAKIEQALGLTTPLDSDIAGDNLYWPEEPIIDIDHLESRLMFENSSDFSASIRMSKQNYIWRAKLYYRFFIFLGLVFLIYLIYIHVAN